LVPGEGYLLNAIFALLLNRDGKREIFYSGLVLWLSTIARGGQPAARSHSSCNPVEILAVEKLPGKNGPQFKADRTKAYMAAREDAGSKRQCGSTALSGSSPKGSERPFG
jgi:hypothetical protein